MFLSKNDKSFLTIDMVFPIIVLGLLPWDFYFGGFMKQKVITYYLRGVCIALALLGLLFFGGFTIYAFNSDSALAGYVKNSLVFLWVNALLCYAILFQFWKVVIEIGRDNSFSKENASSFKKMGFFAGLMSIQYVIRGITSFFKKGSSLVHTRVPHGEALLEEASSLAGGSNAVELLYAFGMAVIMVLFLIICFALSKLILNAYELKQENDLTI